MTTGAFDFPEMSQLILQPKAKAGIDSNKGGQRFTFYKSKITELLKVAKEITSFIYNRNLLQR